MYEHFITNSGSLKLQLFEDAEVLYAASRSISLEESNVHCTTRGRNEETDNALETKATTGT